MDDYVKRLSLGSSVKDVLEPCAKLLHWLSMISNQGYDCKDMETIIKALVFIHECIIRFGNNIVDDLVEQEPFLKAYFERHLNNYRNLNCISSLKEDILQSSNILKNAVILDNLLKNVKDIYSEQMDVKSPKRLPLENKRTKMNLIANRLFQLPPSQIDAAFDKICCEIGFDVLGFIFCVNMDNSMIRQYCILEDKLCNKIINLNSNSVKYFIRSTIRHIAEMDEGETFYKKCLECKKFLQSLCEFFKKFLHYLNNAQNNEVFQFLSHSELFYLLNITIKLKPLEIMRNIENTRVNINISNMLTQLRILFRY